MFGYGWVRASVLFNLEWHRRTEASSLTALHEVEALHECFSIECMRLAIDH